MDDRHSDPEKLPIRCPGCGQRFKVGLDLMDRMVECGTCEHRFRVNDEVVVRQKKFYPGERRDVSLERFSRIPKRADLPSNFRTVQYAQEPVHSEIQPVSPARMVFGFMAVAAVVIVSLILAFGGAPGGMLDGASQVKRLMLAGFTALVAAIFLLAANPRSRGRALFGSLLGAALLLSLPFVFTEGNKPTDPATVGLEAGQAPARDSEELTEEEKLEELKEEIVWEPVEREIRKFEDVPGAGGKSAAGIWLRELREFHKLQIEKYIERSTGADPTDSHVYSRRGGYLMVVSGVTEDLAELARLCERFGEVNRIIEPLRVIEVTVDNSSFEEGPISKLTNKDDPAYYEMNRRELESIDLERAMKAVARLADAEPKLYRKDIVRRMQELLKESVLDPQGDTGLQLQTQIGRALPVWAEEGDGSEAAVLETLEKMPRQTGNVPETLVKFLMLRKDQKAIPLVDELWAADVTRWEDVFIGFGPGIEGPVLARLPDASSAMKRSAARLLAKNGTSKSIPVLEAERTDADGELSVLIDKALAAIRERSGGS